MAVIAKERNIPYEWIAVDLSKGEHKQPAHLAHHPFGQVPYIVVRPKVAFLPLSSLIDTKSYAVISSPHPIVE